MDVSAGLASTKVASAYESTMQFDDYAELREVNPL
jgi:hypothetical protein